MPRHLYWNDTTLVLPHGGKVYRLFQPISRRNLLVTNEFLLFANELVGGLEEGAAREVWNTLNSAPRIVDATAFTLWQNAYVNADFFDSGAGIAQLKELAFADAIKLLLTSGILSTSWPPVLDLAKRSFADRFKGNFYEQIGTEALVRRTQATTWWTQQKFNTELTETLPTPYKFIEEVFLDRYFAEDLPGRTVLEIGCGIGYFTNRIARHAQSVVGIDYNPSYVKMAHERWGTGSADNMDFAVGDMITMTPNEPPLCGRRFDRIVLIDTFLFLFDAVYQKPLFDNRLRIVENLASLLAPNGRLLIFDPHPLWLTPWVGGRAGGDQGEASKPIGILTEYRQRQFKVAPTLEESTQLLFDAGLRIRRVLEPSIDSAYRETNAAAYAFMADIPQWWLIEAEHA